MDYHRRHDDFQPNIQHNPPSIAAALGLAHPSWRPILEAGLQAVAGAQPDYLPALAADHYLPTEGRLFAAFALPREAVRYVLVGEGPYPRAESATGVCFMDGAVGDLWSETGLSKPVNRATSLRNFMKMLLVAGGHLQPDATGGAAMAPVAQAARQGEMIATLAELQANLLDQGFLLLNAALVFRPTCRPRRSARLAAVFENRAGRAGGQRGSVSAVGKDRRATQKPAGGGCAGAAVCGTSV